MKRTTASGEREEKRMEERVSDLFKREDGKRISGSREWMEYRSKWKEILQRELYGTFPQEAGTAEGTVENSRIVYGGRAVLESVRLSFGKEKEIQLPAEILRPVGQGKYPVILWNRHCPEEVCPVEEEMVCGRKFVLASFFREDLAGDAKEAEEEGLMGAYPGYTWGRIAQWAFRMSRLLDYVEKQEYCDRRFVTASGHSRGGKTALCAAIYDERFTMCHANGSGCFGAGSLRIFGGHFGHGFGACETITKMYEAFPYWWGPKLGEYSGQNESGMVADGHLLRALIAPRPVITTEGCGDDWSNPYGTQIMWRAAQEVYDFLGCSDRNAIHYREGGHGFQALDWEALADFMEMQFRDKKIHTNLVSFREELEGEEKCVWKWERPFYEWRMPKKD